jgi:hypothetical protein
VLQVIDQEFRLVRFKIFLIFLINTYFALQFYKLKYISEQKLNETNLKDPTNVVDQFPTQIWMISDTTNKRTIFTDTFLCSTNAGEESTSSKYLSVQNKNLKRIFFKQDCQMKSHEFSIYAL